MIPSVSIGSHREHVHGHFEGAAGVGIDNDGRGSHACCDEGARAAHVDGQVVDGGGKRLVGGEQLWDDAGFRVAARPLPVSQAVSQSVRQSVRQTETYLKYISSFKSLIKG